MLIISLPVKRISFRLKMDIIRTRLDISKDLCLWKNKEFLYNGEHYWELQTKEVKYKDVIDSLKGEFDIIDKFKIRENPYHWVVVCKNTDDI